MEEGQKVDVCNGTVEKNLFLHVYFVRAQDCYSTANANTLANTAGDREINSLEGNLPMFPLCEVGER